MVGTDRVQAVVDGLELAQPLLHHHCLNGKSSANGTGKGTCRGADKGTGRGTGNSTGKM